MRVALSCTSAVALAMALACTGPAPGDITPIAVAARTGDVDTILALARAGHDVNQRDPGLNHWTPLLHAVHKNQRRAVDTLIAAGADVNAGTQAGFTPLMAAVGNGQAPIVRQLLAAGADLGRGDELLAIAVSGGALTDIENPLLGRCSPAVVRALLDRAPGLRVPRNTRGRLALWLAQAQGCSEVIRLAKIRKATES